MYSQFVISEPHNMVFLPQMKQHFNVTTDKLLLNGKQKHNWLKSPQFQPQGVWCYCGYHFSFLTVQNSELFVQTGEVCSRVLLVLWRGENNPEGMYWSSWSQAASSNGVVDPVRSSCHLSSASKFWTSMLLWLSNVFGMSPGSYLCEHLCTVSGKRAHHAYWTSKKVSKEGTREMGRCSREEFTGDLQCCLKYSVLAH